MYDRARCRIVSENPLYVAQAIGRRLPASAVAEELDVNGWMARTTLEMLGQAGLGYSFDNFLDDSTDDYGESLKMFL